MHSNYTFEVNEVFRSLQGEGADTGRSAVFVRMAGCNLACEWCDTDYSESTQIDSEQLIRDVVKTAGNSNLVVFTGGEPLLQPIEQLVPKLKAFGFTVGLETNGTVEVDEYLFASLSLSPKVPVQECKIRRCHSLKLLYPYLPGATPADYHHLYSAYSYIQPILKEGDDEWNSNITEAAAKQVLLLGGQWRLGLQMHKYLEIR